MKPLSRFFLSVFLVFTTTVLFAQDNYGPAIDSIFSRHGEVYFKFRITDRDEISALTRLISIDNVRDGEVFAYANANEFRNMQKHFPEIRLQILPSPGTIIPESELLPPTGNLPGNGQTVWNFYPGYDQYLSYMTAFANDHPSICKIDTVGTSIQGRLILAVKISDNVDQDEAEPQFLYTSSIHGDETAGYVLMLHLIDHLLLNYGTDPELTDLVNSTEIFINPLSNPDGTFRGGNNSVYGAVRYNANNVDLNRNFPDPKLGQHPDGLAWQKETIAWMDYAASHRFSVSANFHGGAEVFNYPWDTWSKLTADDNWWEFVGRMWADTVHKFSPANYFTLMNNGVTNGYAWYELNGGRQDFMNYWHNCREVTLEISNIKLLPTSQLINFWNYNNRSFINYIKQANLGINGIVTDTVTDQPVAAKIFIQGHDFDNSEVYSHLPSGFYARPIYQGSYNLTVSAPGYFTKTINNVGVNNWSATHLDIQLRPLTYDAQDKVESKVLVYPNPSNGILKVRIPDAAVHPLCSIQVINMVGDVVTTIQPDDCHADPTLSLDLSNLPDGLYFLKFNSGYRIYLDKLIIRK